MKGLTRRTATTLTIMVVVVAGAGYWLGVFGPRAICSGTSLASAPDAGTWTRGAAMPTARSEVAAAALDGRIYVAGGLGTGNSAQAFDVYDPGNDTWSQAASLPQGLNHAAIAASDGLIYLTGGYSGLNSTPEIRSTWAYDPGANQWSRRADMPAPRAEHSLANIDGQLYLIGGSGPDSTALWRYDPAGDTWDTSLAEMLTPRNHLIVVSADGKLYAIGGRWAVDGNRATNLDAFEVYDPASDKWSGLEGLPTARGALAAGHIDGTIYTAGGENIRRNCVYPHHEAYSLQSGNWVTLPDLPTPRHGMASAVVDGQWYIIGGGSRAFALTLLFTSDDVEIFDPAVSK